MDSIEQDTLLIKRLVSRYHGSNTYFIEVKGNRELLLVDPGDPDVTLMIAYLKTISSSIHSVWLTHEHSDHCAGVNELYSWQAFPLYCSPVCAANILNPKKNFSAYIAEINTFSVQVPSTTLHHQEVLRVHGKEVKMYATPGHTPGSACFELEGVLFSGDTLMKDYKTPLNFPGSDKKAFHSSISFLMQEVSSDTLVLPGHGSPFYLKQHPFFS